MQTNNFLTMLTDDSALPIRVYIPNQHRPTTSLHKENEFMKFHLDADVVLGGFWCLKNIVGA